jgi:dihydroorotate dehydrogenase electron transfer subunit
MILTECSVQTVEKVADNIFVLTFRSPEISPLIRAGQFVNIKVDARNEPLLRRPFSVYRTEGDKVQIIFNVVGKGSRVLHRKQAGDLLDVLGPLGVPFSLAGDDFDTAILVGGGLGVAPLPLATDALTRYSKKILTFIGAKTAAQLVETHLANVHVATDDGTRGFHGTVVDLIRAERGTFSGRQVKLFVCGPTNMLRAVAEFALQHDLSCEVSLEGPMACGFGICQGCPVELRESDKKYALMCKDGPTFDVRKIKI